MKKLISILLAVTITLSAFMCLGISAAAENTDVLAVTVNGVTTNVRVGDTFTYTYALTDMDIKNCQMVVYYDNDMLSVTKPDYDDDDALAQFKQSTFPVVSDSVVYNLDLVGRIKYNATRVDSYHFVGEQPVATFEFTALAAGEATIRTDVQLLAKSLNEFYVKLVSPNESVVLLPFTSAEYITYEAPEEPTEPETEPTEAPTEEPTQENTEAPTQKPTQKPTEAPTEDPRPKKIENVVVTSTTANTVELSWDQCEDCFKYWIYKLDEETGEWVVQGRTGTPNGVVKNLAPNTTYKFKVTGKFASDNAILSLDDADVYEATTAAPAAPAEITTIMDLDKITVEWDAVEGATKYWLYKATSPDGPFYINGSSLTNSIVVNKLAPDTTYYFKVTSLTYQNGVACFSAVEDSPVLTVTTQNSDDIATKLLSYTANTVTISYPTVDTGYKYWIKYSTTTSDLANSAAWTTVASSTDNTVNTYTLRKLAADTRYFITVRVAYVDTTGANRDYDFTPITVRTPYSDSEFLTFADHPQNANYFTVTWPADVKDVSKAWVYAYDADGVEKSLGSATGTNTLNVRKFDGYENCTYVIKVLNTDGTYGEITPQGGEQYHAD